MPKNVWTFSFILGLLIAGQTWAEAKLTVASPFSDHMVLQQKQALPIWGTASPRAQVSVSLGSITESTQADAAGHWKVALPAFQASAKPLSLAIQSGQETVAFNDVLIGEVWICSGQSNMAWPLAKSNTGNQAIEKASFPQIRFLSLKQRHHTEPQSSFPEKWTVCTPQTARNFSAVGYFFGLELHQKLGVPIGLISTNWGGTPAQAWTSLEALEKAEADFSYYLERREEALKSGPKRLEAHKKKLARWEEKIEENYNSQAGISQEWHSPDFDDSGWETHDFSQKSKFIINTAGSYWLRKTVSLPQAWRGKEVILNLGKIDDLDFTYYNGQLAGKTDRGVKQPHFALRKYEVPASINKQAKATIAIRVINEYAGGGLADGPEAMYLQLKEDPQAVISLGAKWSFYHETHVGKKPRKPSTAKFAGHIYNGMIAPLIPYAIKGSIWYQGESNTGRAITYRALFPTLIKDWRKNWGQGDFPFYFVQLANFATRSTSQDWPRLREAQAMTLALPNTGMAVTIDVGESDDIHPRDKESVGHRLALNALALTYGQDTPYSSPLFAQHEIQDNKILIQFEHTYGELATSDDQAVVGFTIAGEDRKFVPARAVIKGETISVSHPEIKKPVAIRYAWANDPENNLINKIGLPASPFRTDDWAPVQQ